MYSFSNLTNPTKKIERKKERRQRKSENQKRKKKKKKKEKRKKKKKKRKKKKVSKKHIYRRPLSFISSLSPNDKHVSAFAYQPKFETKNSENLEINKKKALLLYLQ